jgi:protein-disulfide isomerase
MLFLNPRRFLLMVLLAGSSAWIAVAPVLATEGSPVARIQDRSISLAELDAAGGRPLYDAASQLYEARVRALHQLLSTDLLEREARAQGVAPEKLLETHVTSRVSPVTASEVEAFLKSQPDSAATPRRSHKDAELYLNMRRHAQAKRDYLNQLFKRYDVRVLLETPPPPPAELIEGPLEPAIGAATAPVTIIVFSDYLCPYCRDLSRTLDTLLARDPNRLRVVYRAFPTQPRADTIAQAALCAQELGDFPNYHRLLFESPGAADELSALAQRAGLDQKAFDACLASGRHRERVAADVKEGQRLQIQGTPTLFVNGQRLRGAQPLARLSAQIAALTATAAPSPLADSSAR